MFTLKLALGDEIIGIYSTKKSFVGYIKQTFPLFVTNKKQTLAVRVSFINKPGKRFRKDSDDKVLWVKKKTVFAQASGVLSSWRLGSDVFRVLINSAYNKDFLLFKFCFPILFRAYIIRKGKGVLMHASGLGYRDKGYVFCGHSGSGKSYVSKQLLKKKGFEQMNDETLLLQPKKGGVVVHSAFIRGDLPPKNNSFKLGKIFFLMPSKKTSVVGLAPMHLFFKLMEFSFLTRLDNFKSHGVFINNYISLLGEIAEKTQGEEIHFVKTKPFFLEIRGKRFKVV